MEKYGYEPDKPKDLEKRAGDKARCPSCGNLLTGHPPVCPNCGSRPFERSPDEQKED